MHTRKLWRRHNLIRLLLNSNRDGGHPEALRVEDLHHASEGWPGQPDHPSGQMAGLGKCMKAMGRVGDGEDGFSHRAVRREPELQQIMAIVDRVCDEAISRYAQKHNDRWKHHERVKQQAIQKGFQVNMNIKRQQASLRIEA